MPSLFDGTCGIEDPNRDIMTDGKTQLWWLSLLQFKAILWELRRKCCIPIIAHRLKSNLRKP